MDNDFKFRLINIKDSSDIEFIDSLYRFEELGISEVENGIAKGFLADYYISRCFGYIDKNNKLIYEHDIIRFHEDIFTVFYGELRNNLDKPCCNPYFGWFAKETFFKKDEYNWGKTILKNNFNSKNIEEKEVIGNIYQNKDLLERI